MKHYKMFPQRCYEHVSDTKLWGFGGQRFGELEWEDKKDLVVLVYSFDYALSITQGKTFYVLNQENFPRSTEATSAT